MGANTTIRSRSNPLLKRVGAVLAGKDERALVLEGERLIDDALAAGLALEVVLVDEDRSERADALRARTSEVRLVAAGLLARASALETSPGVLALCPRPAAHELEELDAGGQALVLVAAGVSDPGNLGALARSAEAAGARALVVLRGGASPWGPKALRGSMGSVLRLPCYAGVEAARAARVLADKGLRQVRAATRGGRPPGELDWSGPLALWIGAETGALPAAARGFEPVTIPTARGVESLNVTVAAALLLFAAGRVAGGAARGERP